MSMLGQGLSQPSRLADVVSVQLLVPLVSSQDHLTSVYHHYIVPHVHCVLCVYVCVCVCVCVCVSKFMSLIKACTTVCTMVDNG